MKSRSAPHRRGWIPLALCALLEMAVHTGASTNLSIALEADAALPMFIPFAAGQVILNAAEGRVEVAGDWQPEPIHITSYREVSSAHVFDYTQRDSHGVHPSRPFSSDHQTNLVEVLLEVALPSGARAVNVSGAALLTWDNRSIPPLGYDTVRTAGPSSFFSEPDNSLCVVESLGEVPVVNFVPLSTATPHATLVYLADSGATRPLPIRLLFAVPSDINSFRLNGTEE